MAGNGPLPGNDIMSKKMHGIASRAGFLEPLFAAMLVSFHKLEDQRFEDEGPGWAALADSTESVKSSLGYGNSNILERTTELWTSLTGAGQYSNAGLLDDGWEAISTVPYAGFHQMGFTHIGGTEVPARPPVDPNLAENAGPAWMLMIREYVFEGVIAPPDWG